MRAVIRVRVEEEGERGAFAPVSVLLLLVVG